MICRLCRISHLMLFIMSEALRGFDVLDVKYSKRQKLIGMYLGEYVDHGKGKLL